MKRNLFFAMGLCTLIAFASCSGSGLDYPVTEKENVVDDYFGTKVEDPYRWLENDTSARVAEWVKAQNALTGEYLLDIPFQSGLRRRLQQLMDYDTESTPSYTGKYYIYFAKEGLSNQQILYIKDSLSGTPRILLDPNTFSSDGTIALGGLSVSNDSKYLAYALADGGSDWRTIHVMDIATGERLTDEVRWVKFSGIAWEGDGFYYSRYDAPSEGSELSNINEYHKVYYHRIGDPQSSDRLVYENRNEPLRNYYASVTRDEKYLIISETESTDGNSLYIKNLKTPGVGFVQLTTGFDYDYSVIGSDGDDLYILTNYKAPKYRLVRVDMDRSDVGDWVDIVEEHKDVLSSATLAGGHVVTTHMVDAASRMSVYSLNGEFVREVNLGVLGSVTSVQGRLDRDELFYGYTSFTIPSVVYRYIVSTGEVSEYYRPTFDFDFSRYTVEQVFFESRDGTKVPMFLAYRSDIKRDGKNPTLLYGYGGFNISLTPGFSPSRLAWLEQGGVYAMACLRGGGEYGERWHLSGTKLNKQNVFDDCIAAAEYLQKEQFTSRRYLAVQGGSNGGLLVGAVVNQRPDLFGVAIPQVGVMDMLRYQHFTIGWAWAGDYGTSDEEDQFQNLYSYSPLHNIKRGSDYPAVLVTTADHDDRVVPAHSFKYIATLQGLQSTGAPKLIRIETRAGHGAGKPMSLTIEEQADIYSFIFHNMGVTPLF